MSTCAEERLEIKEGFANNFPQAVDSIEIVLGYPINSESKYYENNTA